LQQLRSVEERVARFGEEGATPAELEILRDAIRSANTLLDDQAEALAAHDRGRDDDARQILFGGRYERDLDHSETLLERFQDRLDERTEAQVAAARQVSSLWKRTSEAVLAVTGLLFLCVLSLIFKRRVLRPVVRLSDVVGRLAAQDYGVEPPVFDQIDEIGDMAHAIRIFRENGIVRQRLEEEREADLAVRDLIARMTQRMQGCDNLFDLKEVIRRFVPEIAPALAGRLYIQDHSRNAVVEACSWLDPLHSNHEFAPSACWALRRGLPHRPTGHAIDIPCEHLDAGGGGAGTLCYPLMAQRETLGLLYFELRSDAAAAEVTQEMYLQMLAENIGLALANLKLRDALRELAMVDPLTGLANRRHMESVLAQRASEAETLGRPLSCLMVDVDHFKRFNDSFGHDAGDAVLREVGACLKSVTRNDGLAFRYGGEEFLVLLPEVDPDQAFARGEQIRSRVAELRLTHDGNALGAITISAGLATAPVHCTADRLIQCADAALLSAKSAGRDRIVTAEPSGLQSAA
jgi:diguanylate cyclase (GGDEF)-like protein